LGFFEEKYTDLFLGVSVRMPSSAKILWLAGT